MGGQAVSQLSAHRRNPQSHTGDHVTHRGASARARDLLDYVFIHLAGPNPKTEKGVHVATPRVPVHGKPLAKHNMTKPAPASEPAPPAFPRPWILVVDDEPSMRLLIEVVLRSQDWVVVSADGAEDALDALKAHPLPPSVVICDVLMPGLDGLELIRRMCARLPGLNVIFISGRLSDVSWWPTDLREHRFLAKPFEKDQLIAAVRDALAAASAG